MGNPAFRKRKSDDAGTDDWLITYCDLITQLLAFFAILASISTVDVNKYQQVQASIESELGRKEVVQPNALLKIDLQDLAHTLGVEGQITVGSDADGVVMELASTAFYNSGSAEIREEMLPALQEIARVLKAPRYDSFQIEVQGHTDDTPIATPQFPSNWELSSGRATRIVRFLMTKGLKSDRLKATGFADSHPKLPNRDAKNAPLPDNQAKNRRIVVRLSQKPFK